jgi:hypothetical protein
MPRPRSLGALPHWVLVQQALKHNTSACSLGIVDAGDEMESVFVGFAFRDPDRDLADSVERIPAGASLEQFITGELRRMDAMVVIVSRRTSPWLERELKAFRSTGGRVVPVFLGPQPTEIPGDLKVQQAIQVKPTDDLKELSAEVASRINGILRQV